MGMDREREWVYWDELKGEKEEEGAEEEVG